MRVSGSVDVVMVEACLRGGGGGSPTAVVMGRGDLQDADFVRIPPLVGASHVVWVGPPVAAGDSREVRFFTATGELPACGHGTVAAITAVATEPRRVALAAGAGQVAEWERFEGRLRAGGRDFDASGRSDPSGGYDPSGATVETWFDQGLVGHRFADEGLVGDLLAALGLGVDDLHPGDVPAVASPGMPRLLLPVADRDVLSALAPDRDRLVFQSRRHGLLGCFAYTPSAPGRRAAGRMFAPAIGVPEDVANANSVGCLAAHLLATGRDPSVAVDQGDALGRPSTVYADAARTADGIVTRVGGVGRLAGTLQVPTG